MFHDIHDVDNSGWAVSVFIWVISLVLYLVVCAVKGLFYGLLWLGITATALFSLHLLYHYKVYLNKEDKNKVNKR